MNKGYLDKDGNYVEQNSDNKPVRIYKNVNVNRDVDDFMAHTEARGWLHNWCKCMGFEKPMYDTEEIPLPKGKKKFKAKLKVQTKFGEELDISPEYTDTNKKGALTEVAWIFIEECVKRGLLDDNLVPHRETASCLKNRNGVSKDDMADSGLDFSPEAHAEGGFWKLGNCVQRLTAFCYAIRQPLNIQLNSWGEDHNRKTKASCSIIFHVKGEETVRKYSFEIICNNKKQAQAAVSLALIRGLFKDGFIEACGKREKRPPNINFETSGFDKAEDGKDLKSQYGGWLESNSAHYLDALLRVWNCPPDICYKVETIGENSRSCHVMFKTECRLQMTMVTREQIHTKKDLYSVGKFRSKKDAKNICAMHMRIRS